MKTIETHGSYRQAVAGRSDRVREIAGRLRTIVSEVYPDAVEVPWPKQGIIGYGVGPKKMSEHFCYIGLYKEHVNLGFYYGVDLPDPEGLLDGSGKKLRHVKLSGAEEADRPAIRALIQASLLERQSALGID